MLKISGESLAGSNEQGFDFEILNDLAKSIKILQSKNLKISIVLGGGNFIPPKVYKNDKYVGYFSYNGRFWREKYPFPQLEKDFAI